MRFSNLITLVVSLLLGIAAGGYYSTEREPSARTFEPTQIFSFHPRNSEMPGGGSIHEMGTGTPGSTPFDSEDFSALVDEPNTYAAIKGLLAYMDHLRPEDFPKALSQLKSSSENNRDEALDILIGKWMEVDPNGAVNILPEARKLETPELAAQVISGVYAAWADSDPANALADARQSLTGTERQTALKAIIDKVAQDDPAQALDLVKGMGPSLVPDYLPSIFSHWADKDTPAATQALLQLPGEKQRTQAIQGIADQLVQNDPQSALTWMDQLPPGKMRDAAQGAVADQWAQIDPHAAIKWAEGLPTPAKDTVVDEIAEQWTPNDAAGLIQYASTLPDGPEKDRLQGGLGIAQWAFDDAQSAWAWAQGLPADKKNDALATISSSWAEYDPAAATANALALPQGPTRDTALAAVANDWDYANTDPAQTTAWMAQLPTGLAHDAAAGKFSEEVVKTDPQRAVEMASSISDAQARQSQLTDLYQKWMQTDPASAKTSVANSDLPTDVKNRFIQPKP